MYRVFGKRLLDLLLCLIAFVFATPLILIIALLVRIRLGSPVFFRQQRPGLHGSPFQLIKFRTMLEASDPSGRPLPDKERLTSFGNFLRHTSLDELPELLNILRGEMSFIGPRPLLMSYLGRYDEEQMRRHDLKPGLTGWAQINGRNALSWEERFKLDIWYVENSSLALDLKILWLTLIKVIRREGISAEDSATMHEFKGTK